MDILIEHQFTEIAVQRLTKEEGISEKLATKIAKQVMQELNRKDLRDCIKVVRITKTPDEIVSVVGMMKKWISPLFGKSLSFIIYFLF
jgi:hypothetical protein